MLMKVAEQSGKTAPEISPFTQQSLLKDTAGKPGQQGKPCQRRQGPMNLSETHRDRLRRQN